MNRAQEIVATMRRALMWFWVGFWSAGILIENVGLTAHYQVFSWAMVVTFVVVGMLEWRVRSAKRA